MRRALRGTAAVAALLACAARAGEPRKFEPVSGEEKAKLLAAESPAQKKLRAELAAMKGTRVLFNANTNGRDDVYVMNPDGSGLKQLTPEGGSYPHLSPDGRRIVFCRGNYDDRGGEKLGADEIGKLPFDPSMPLDWKRVRPGKVASYLWLMDADGSNARRVAQGILPHWSPNGRAVTYTVIMGRRKWQAMLLDLERNAESSVVAQGLRVGGFPSFSPDGRWLFLTQGPGVLVPLNKEQTGVAPDGTVARAVGGHPCNGEVSPDGRWLTWVVDTHSCLGSWLRYAEVDLAAGKVGKPRDADLGWDRKTVNYYPDFSPCSKYYVYAHAGMEKDVKSWLVAEKQELYVSRFPPDGVSVRVTWTNAACQHPHWAAAAAAGE